MQTYKKYIPSSGFFWGLSIGLVLTTTTIFTVIPGYKIFPIMPIQSLSGDSLSLSDTQKALEEIYHLVSIQYYDTGSLDQNKMSHQVLSAFVDALGDPFSSYLPPVEDKELTDSIAGKESIEGIGAVLSKKNGGVLVEEILKSSPAAQADLRPLDMIVKVNGSGVQQYSIGEIVQRIRGPRGTKVTLTIARPISGTLSVLEKDIERDTILIPSVASKIFSGTISDHRIGYIALSLFAQDTDERMQTEIAKLKTIGISGLILDLRGNGGGLLPESVDVASHFLVVGTPVVQAKYRLYTDSLYKAVGNDTLSAIPLVILVDGFTASASEIITLGIKEGRCKNIVSGTGWIQSAGWSHDCDVLIIGEKTFGKGSIQNLQELSFGGSVKLTVGKRFAPSGLSIDHIGIQPDITVSFDKERYSKNGIDTPLERAKSILSQKIL